jgi:hypothetical protein
VVVLGQVVEIEVGGESADGRAGHCRSGAVARCGCESVFIAVDRPAPTPHSVE